MLVIEIGEAGSAQDAEPPNCDSTRPAVTGRLRTIFSNSLDLYWRLFPVERTSLSRIFASRSKQIRCSEQFRECHSLPTKPSFVGADTQIVQLSSAPTPASIADFGDLQQGHASQRHRVLTSSFDKICSKFSRPVTE